MKATAILLTTTVTSVSCFSVCPLTQQNTRCNNNIHATVRSSNTALNGLFDGVKEAFTTPSSLDPERETPIDRWMGWSVVSENETGKKAAAPVGKYNSECMKWTLRIALKSITSHTPFFLPCSALTD